MGFFDFLNKKKRKNADAKQTEQHLRVQAILDRAESICIGWHHVSGPVHILCSVQYVPSEALVIASTSSSDEPIPHYQILSVPEYVKDAESLIRFVEMSGPWLHIGYQLDAALEQRINEYLKPAATGVIVPCCEKPVPARYAYCPYCGQPIGEGSAPCDVTIDPDVTVWLCGQCGSDNPFENKYCGTCGKKR